MRAWHKDVVRLDIRHGSPDMLVESKPELTSMRMRPSIGDKSISRLVFAGYLVVVAVVKNSMIYQEDLCPSLSHFNPSADT